MSKRYIDADKIVLTAERGIVTNGLIFIPMCDVRQSIEKTPTADVVEVVRCKDCKYADEWDGKKFECRCPYTPWATDEYAIVCEPTHYCSHGERKEK